MKVCLLNDSFPPAFDGVIATVLNYGAQLKKKGNEVMLIVPDYPGSEKTDFDFPVVRYPCFPLWRMDRYRLGNFLSRKAVRQGTDFAPDVIHCHVPAASMMTAFRLRRRTHAPVIFTYHTKVSFELPRVAKPLPLRRLAQKVCVKMIEHCDDVWCVCEDAAKDLRSLGYRGEITLMSNGVDMPKGKVSTAEIRALRETLSLPEGVPVYLFVGRMIWYKGLDMILDALHRLSLDGRDFRMIFVGDGSDEKAVKARAKELELMDRCLFTGSVLDRHLLRTLYSAADLFLLPSAYDNAPITVREALACACPSVLIRGSGSAEGFTDGKSAFLIEKDPLSLYEKLREIGSDFPLLHQAGEAAMNELYLPWSDAVDPVIERYRWVVERKKDAKTSPISPSVSGADA